MKRHWALLVAAVGLACGPLAGCSGIPEQGEIQSTEWPAPGDNAGEVAVEALGPAQGAQPAQIVDGFILAMAEYEPGYTTAKQFLTPQAAERWRPGTTTRVYTDLSGLNLARTDPLHPVYDIPAAQLIGQLGPHGVYTAWSGGEDVSVEFQLAQDAQGEYRIDGLPDGVIMTRARFDGAYQRVDTYYFDDQGEVLIPDTRYLPRSNWLRQALQALLAGPSDRVADIVTADPVNRVSLADDLDPRFDGAVVEVPLDDAAAALTVPEATRLAVLCAATLRSYPGIEAIRLVAADGVLPVDGARADGSLGLAEAARYDADADATQTYGALHVLRGGVVTEVDGEAWAGDLGQTAREATALAVGPRSDTVAVVTAAGLAMDAPGASQSVEPVTAAGLIRPQYDRDDRLWAMAALDGGGTRAWVVERGDDPGGADPSGADPSGADPSGADPSGADPSGADPSGADQSGADPGGAGDSEAHDVRAPALAGLTVRAFRLSPDGRRMAVVADGTGEGTPKGQLGLVEVRHGADGKLSLDGWRPVPAVLGNAPLAGMSDVVWEGPSTLAVLGSSQGSEVNALFRVRLDGIETAEEIGRPSGDRLLTMVAARPGGGGLVVLDDSGAAHQWLDSHEWQLLASGIEALAYPG